MQYNNNIVQVNNITYSIGTIGKHYAYVSAIIIALIETLGLDINYYLEYFNDIKPLDGRGIYKEYKYNGKKFTVVDDTYNASPSSMNASLEILKQFNKNKIIVIGEMLELGNYSEYYHNKLADTLNNIENTKIYFIGKRNLHKIINKYNNIKCYEELNEDIIKTILNTVENNSILFLKGSRGIKLEKFLTYLI